MWQAGETIQERFSVLGPLGRGGMASVFVARHLQLDTIVALKVLDRVSPSIRARLMREARLQANLRHDHIVEVLDVVVVDGYTVVIMRYAEGGSLAGLLDHCLEDGLPGLPVDTWIEAARQLLAGLAAAHAQGVVHRDLKPDNLLLARKGARWVVQIADFGIAKAVHQEEDGGPRTRTHAAMGTPEFMAPEQVTDAASVTSAADIFAVGTTLYALAVGDSPFVGRDTLDTMIRVRDHTPTALRQCRPDLPAGLCRIVEVALNKAPGDRWADAATMLAAWEADAPPAPPGAIAPRRPVADVRTSLPSTPPSDLAAGTLRTPPGPSVPPPPVSQPTFLEGTQGVNQGVTHGTADLEDWRPRRRVGPGLLVAFALALLAAGAGVAAVALGGGSLDTLFTGAVDPAAPAPIGVMPFEAGDGLADDARLLETVLLAAGRMVDTVAVTDLRSTPAAKRADAAREAGVEHLLSLRVGQFVEGEWILVAEIQDLSGNTIGESIVQTVTGDTKAALRTLLGQAGALVAADLAARAAEAADAAAKPAAPDAGAPEATDPEPAAARPTRRTPRPPARKPTTRTTPATTPPPPDPGGTPREDPPAPPDPAPTGTPERKPPATPEPEEPDAPGTEEAPPEDAPPEAPPEAPATRPDPVAPDITRRMDLETRIPAKPPAVRDEADARAMRASAAQMVIKSAVRAHMGQLRQCYDASLKRDNTLGGDVIVAIAVDDMGHVDVRDIAPTPGLNNTMFLTCLTKRIEAWTMPPGAATEVRIPFSFRPQPDAE